ncbi:MAG TPA: hypothetical protein VH744_10530 [Terriglobales bacterium]
MSCSICGRRKEKRFCPAEHARICPQCCGEQREVTLDCPSECTYLQQARQHEKPRSAQDIDPAALFPHVEIADQFVYQQEHLLTGLSFALAARAQSDATLRDADLIAALSAMARSYETLVNSGLHYEVPVAGLHQQEIQAQIQKMVQDYRATEQKHMGYSRLRDADVLHALVFLVRMGHRWTSGRPKSRAFIDFLVAQFPERQSSLATADGAGSRIIAP